MSFNALPILQKEFKRVVFLETAVLLEIEKFHNRKEDFDILTISEYIRKQWEDGILEFRDFSEISEELLEDKIDLIIEELFKYKFIPNFVRDGLNFKFLIDEDENIATIKPEINTKMKTTTTLKELVINVAKSFVDKKTPFSAHQITASVRNIVNEGVSQGDLEITGLVKTTFPNFRGETYEINHEEVRGLVLDAFNLKTFPGYDRQLKGGYWQYFYNATVSQPTQPTLSVSKSRVYPDKTKDKELAVISYVDTKRLNNQTVTLKQIQSCLKRKPLLVSQIYDICLDAGYVISINPTALSKSTVT